MPTPFLLGLNLRARTAFPIIMRGVNIGLSGNAIQNVLISSGLGIQRTVLQAIIREIKGVGLKSNHLKSIPSKLNPDSSRLPEALHKIRRNYSFTFEVTAYDRNTGESVIRNTTLSTDRLHSRQAMEDAMLDILSDDANQYALEDIRVQLVSGVKAGPEGTL